MMLLLCPQYLFLTFPRIVFLVGFVMVLSFLLGGYLCFCPQTSAHQAPPSLGFSRQEHWSGLPFPSLMHESEK